MYVNCSDCATFTSTFSNVLGCDLWQSRMGPPVGQFALNDMLAIGSNVWQTACQGIDGWSGSFSYHEVAWKGACLADDHIFDACLQVDGDADPTMRFLAFSIRHLESLLTPQALDPLVVHRPPFSAGLLRGAPPPPPGTHGAERPQPLAQQLFVLGSDGRLEALG